MFWLLQFKEEFSKFFLQRANFCWHGVKNNPNYLKFLINMCYNLFLILKRGIFFFHQNFFFQMFLQFSYEVGSLLQIFFLNL
jgi:hypothetical protein